MGIDIVYYIYKTIVILLFMQNPRESGYFVKSPIGKVDGEVYRLVGVAEGNTVDELAGTHRRFSNYAEFLSISDALVADLRTEILVAPELPGLKFVTTTGETENGYILQVNSGLCIVNVKKVDGTNLVGNVGWKNILIPSNLTLPNSLDTYGEVQRIEAQGIDDLPLTIRDQAPAGPPAR